MNPAWQRWRQTVGNDVICQPGSHKEALLEQGCECGPSGSSSHALSAAPTASLEIFSLNPSLYS